MQFYKLFTDISERILISYKFMEPNTIEGFSIFIKTLQ